MIKLKIKNFLRKILLTITPLPFHIRQNGFCPICEKKTIFISKNTWLRDYFLCMNCGSLPRQRALMVIIEKYYPDWRNLSIHEAGPSPEYYMTKKLPMECKNYIVSKYYQQEEFGVSIDGNRNEDLEKQTFLDNTFDIVITQDIFEHLYNPEKAFLEIIRTLKHGGAHIFTVPVINRFQKTEIWAIKSNQGAPIFLNKEEFHGPYPVTIHWGYDIVDFIKKHTALETKIEYIHDLEKGIWAEYIEIFVTKKI